MAAGTSKDTHNQPNLLLQPRIKGTESMIMSKSFLKSDLKIEGSTIYAGSEVLEFERQLPHDDYTVHSGESSGGICSALQRLCCSKSSRDRGGSEGSEDAVSGYLESENVSLETKNDKKK